MKKGIIITILAVAAGAGIWAISRCGGKACPLSAAQTQTK